VLLKGPKREIFVAGIFAQIRPIWLGYLVNSPKIQKSNVWGLLLLFISRDFCFSAVGDSAKKNFLFEQGRKKKFFLIASLITYLPLKGFFEFLIFTLF
jgi:hypothetical protein